MEKLWFLAMNDDVVGVFDDYDIAQEELEFLKQENSKDSVLLKRRKLVNLPKNSEEYLWAKERGYL